MKEIFKYLKNHLKEDFRAGYYIALCLFIALCIAVNYSLDFEDSIIDSYYGKSIRIFYFFLFYGFAYYGATALLVIFKERYDIVRNPWFWLKSAFILFLIALDGGFHYHDLVVRSLVPSTAHYFTAKVVKNLINILTMILPMIIFYRLYDRHVGSFYGLTLRGFNYKPYLFMLLIMIPVVAAASFTENFNDFYPIYKKNSAHAYFQIAEWIPALVYELAYGWNFLTVELAFRGFMVLSLASIMGRNVVVPMVVTYCFYHFGKPGGEAISSILGGYILGVIAYESRSVFGGIIIHVGVAWMMEFFAWLQQKI